MRINITDILSQVGGLRSVASELGVSETQAARGAEALIPAILGGFKKQAQTQPAGLWTTFCGWPVRQFVNRNAFNECIEA